MQLVVLGLNHKTVSVDIREQFAISEESARSGLRHLDEQEGIEEAVVLSTCNRTEIYAVLKDSSARKTLEQFFLALSGNSEAKKEYFFYFEGEACIRHLFEVASGLDSMVIGESQILNQIKTAYTMALAEKATKTILNTLFHRAITTGKRVRTETRISYSAVSVSYAAVKLAEKILGGLDDRTAMVFGAGEAAELLVKNLQGKGLKNVKVANRHMDKAEALLAKTIGGEAVPFKSALSHADDVDIIVTATGASQYIVKAWDVRNLMMRRNTRPLVAIDIAVPCDIEPEVGDIRNVTLYNLDDLQEIVANNIRLRKEEAERAEVIVQEEIDSIEDRFKYLSTRPVMVSLSDKAEAIRERELRHGLAKIEGLTEEDKKVLSHMTHMIVRKILREPMMHLNEYAGTEWESEDKSAVSRLFKLDVRKGQQLEK
ncbi:glutamyl-tRNA reductase [uncultured Dialister sp.]|jgi:glutamyl-tRNA reductase|uniref:glutamyl-tRNA reductase n=1 Tax=uncultured Dialister sp. TaxID=278064 RepID=UPI00265DF4DE|nr:glutamyl-tRNA reductase [uncultured Dialister sp.]